MNILQITKYYYPSESFGGPVQATRNISKNMIKKGHDVTVYTTDAYDISSKIPLKEKYFVIDGAKVFFFHNVLRSHGFFVSPSIIKALRENLDTFDVVHLHEYRSFQNLAFYYLRKLSIPYVVSLHGELEYQKEALGDYLLRRLYNSAFGRNFLKNATKILALTQFEKQQLINAGISEKQISIVPNAINIRDFVDLASENTFRSKFGLTDEKIILFVGRLNNFKGLDVLVKAFSLLKNSEKLKLVIAGPDDGMLVFLQKLVVSLQLVGNVLFTGLLPHAEILQAINESSIIVYASIQEGFPTVPLEGGAAGKPVVVSNHPSMSFVAEGKFGLIVKYGDSQQLAKALDKLLNDTSLAKELGQNGRKYVLGNFSWDVISNKISDVYNEVAVD